MKQLLKKRQLVLSALIVALAAAVFANWYFTKPKTTPVSGSEPVTTDAQSDSAAKAVNASGAEAYFASVRLQRDTARDAALETVKDVMAGIEDAESSEVLEANVSIAKISQDIKLESDIEALVSAKTGSDCVAVINGDAIQIVIPKTLIDETVALQICDIVLDNTDIKSDNIKIIGA